MNGYGIDAGPVIFKGIPREAVKFSNLEEKSEPMRKTCPATF